MGSIPEGESNELSFYDDQQRILSAKNQHAFPTSSTISPNMLAYTPPYMSDTPYQQYAALNYNFMSGPPSQYQPATLSFPDGWSEHDANAQVGYWHAQQMQGLRLQTDFTPPEYEMKSRYSIDTPYSAAVTGSSATGSAVDPSQISNDSSSSPRKRSKGDTSTTTTTPSTNDHKHKRSRTLSKVTTDPEDDQVDEEDEGKRQKFLARNRVAASKCREKKKEATKHLEERARMLSTQRNELNQLRHMLRSELVTLKDQCLAHRDCNCQQIRDYLQSTVAALAPASELYQERSYGSGSSLAHFRRGSEVSAASPLSSGRLVASEMAPSETAGSFPPSPSFGIDS